MGEIFFLYVEENKKKKKSLKQCRFNYVEIYICIFLTILRFI